MFVFFKFQTKKKKLRNLIKNRIFILKFKKKLKMEIMINNNKILFIILCGKEKN